MTICNPDGSHQKIVLVHPEIELPRWTVKFHDGSKLVVMEEHLWQAWRSGKRKKLFGDRKGKFGEDAAQVVTTRTLKDWVDKAKRQNESGRNRPEWPLIPVCREQRFNVTCKRSAAIDPYLLGLILGDGYFPSSRYGISITSEDHGHIENTLNALGYEYSVDKKKDNSARGYRLIGEKSAELKHELSRIGLKGKKSHDKFIPREFLWGS